ncbi:MAG: hypothetical protein LAT51_09995 [Flavobacteriaceae bacterium]|nr:hypothetical protein [Flavobacteriaceae bacterium]
MKVKKDELVKKLSALNTESNSPNLVIGDHVYYKTFSAQWSSLDKEVEIKTSRIECEVVGIKKKAN